MQRKIYERLEKGQATVQQLSELVYGEYTTFSVQGIHSAIYRMKQKGIKIKKDTDILDQRLAYYKLEK